MLHNQLTLKLFKKVKNKNTENMFINNIFVKEAVHTVGTVRDLGQVCAHNSVFV